MELLKLFQLATLIYAAGCFIFIWINWSKNTSIMRLKLVKLISMQCRHKLVKTRFRTATCAQLNNVCWLDFWPPASQKIKVQSVLLEVCLSSFYWSPVSLSIIRIPTVLPRPAASQMPLCPRGRDRGCCVFGHLSRSVFSQPMFPEVSFGSDWEVV